MRRGSEQRTVNGRGCKAHTQLSKHLKELNLFQFINYLSVEDAEWNNIIDFSLPLTSLASFHYFREKFSPLVNSEDENQSFFLYVVFMKFILFSRKGFNNFLLWCFVGAIKTESKKKRWKLESFFSVKKIKTFFFLASFHL